MGVGYGGRVHDTLPRKSNFNEKTSKVKNYLGVGTPERNCYQ